MEQEEGGRFYVRMEEEEEGGTPIRRQPIGFASPHTEPDDDSRPEPSTTIVSEILRSLTEERRKIIDNDKLSSREKLKLLENNRTTMAIATGGRINKTENVVYSILVFG